jgi:short-subunit dehydrogenase
MSRPLPTRYRAVLTGASGGIGAAVAQALLPQCDALLLVGRNPQALQTLSTRLNSPKVQVAALDITQPNAPAQLAELAKGMGGINLLVNNAGISQFGAFANQAPDDMARLLAVNLLAPMLCNQALLPQLLAEPSACIVHVGSMFGYIGFPANAAYCASKFGLRGHAQALRRELADSPVVVKYFAPRATRTPLNSPQVQAMNRELGTTEDSPEWVAAQLLEFLKNDSFEKKLGWPERFFAVLNQIAPGIPDRALARQLPVIRKHLA